MYKSRACEKLSAVSLLGEFLYESIPLGAFDFARSAHWESSLPTSLPQPSGHELF